MQPRPLPAFISTIILLAGAAWCAPVDTVAKPEKLEWLYKRIQPPNPDSYAREAFYFALEAAEAHWRPDLVEKAFEFAKEMQDRNPESRTYGNFRWFYKNDRPYDLNAVEFSMQHAAVIWKHLRDRLTPRAREQLKELMLLSIEGMRRHGVQPAYTNIYTMKTWNMIALGEMLGKPDVAQEGYDMLDLWLGHVWQHGVQEYLSPTYQAVTMYNLALISNNAAHEKQRNLGKAAMRLLWSQVAANWYEPGQRLGGAHSRDYDFTRGLGLLDEYAAVNGLMPPGSWLDPRWPAFRVKYAASPVPPEAKALMDIVPRFVRQRFGEASFANAAQYVGRNFSIGSAGASSGQMDKVLVACVGKGRGLPVVNFVMDSRLDPYGSKRFELGKSGHSKALHLSPMVARVQRGPEVVLIASTSPQTEPYMRTNRMPKDCLLSHFTMPDVMQVYTGAEGPAIEKADHVSLQGDLFFLRHEDVAIALRVPVATSESGKRAAVELVRDNPRRHAMRLTFVHASKEPMQRATIALWMRGAEGLDDAGFAAFRKTIAQAPIDLNTTEGRVDLAVPGLEGRLRVTADARRELPIAHEGEEPGVGDVLLSVNGRDVGREILEALEPVAAYRKRVESFNALATKPIGLSEEILEAESSDLVLAPFTALDHPQASGGKYVVIPNNSATRSDNQGARAIYPIEVQSPGDYAIWMRVLAPTPADDSVYLFVEQDGRTILHKHYWSMPIDKAFNWAQVKRGTVPVTIPLQKGLVRLKITGREDGSGVDAIVLTKNPNWQPPR